MTPGDLWEDAVDAVALAAAEQFAPEVLDVENPIVIAINNDGAPDSLSWKLEAGLPRPAIVGA